MMVEPESVTYFYSSSTGFVEQVIETTYGIKICQDDEGRFACFPKGTGSLGFLYSNENSYHAAKRYAFAYTALNYAIALYLILHLAKEGIMDVATQQGFFAAMGMTFSNHGLLLILVIAMRNIKSIPREISMSGTRQPVAYAGKNH